MKQFFICLILLICFSNTKAQDSLLQKLPDKYFSQVEHKSRHIAQKVNQRTDKVLDRFAKEEKIMQARLWKVDSMAAKNIFSGSIDKLNAFKSSVPDNLPLGGDAYLDTLGKSLTFLKDSKNISGSSKDKLNAAAQSVKDLQGRLQYAEEVKAYLRSRKQQLKEQLSQYTGFTKDLQKLNKEAYYYSEQLREYKSLFHDRKKAEAKAMTLLKKLPAYNDFLSENSQLAGLFNYNEARNLEGLQTRSQVDQLLQQRIGNSPDARQAVSQQMEQARSQFAELKSKFPALDNAAEMPDFKPREMKTKTLLQRLEPAGNIQFQKSNQFFPVTTDLAVQLAYRLNKNSSIGLGAACKLGLGSDWSHIRLSHQAIGIRCFADYRLRGTFFINGGFEGNRNTGFKNIAELKHWNGFTMSALFGISKKYRVSPKLKGNIMVLYDFLAPRQLPKTDNIKVRFGYSL